MELMILGVVAICELAIIGLMAWRWPKVNLDYVDRAIMAYEQGLDRAAGLADGSYVPPPPEAWRDATRPVVGPTEPDHRPPQDEPDELITFEG